MSCGLHECVGKPYTENPKEPDHREFVSGFIRLHILHHAAQEPLVGFWMIEELRRHGYEMSPGTIYPLLHSLQKKGYLSVEVKREGTPRLAGVFCHQRRQESAQCSQTETPRAFSRAD